MRPGDAALLEDVADPAAAEDRKSIERLLVAVGARQRVAYPGVWMLTTDKVEALLEASLARGPKGAA